MITRVRFENFKALKNADLKLGQFNVIVGPNGSGKSTVCQALNALKNPAVLQFDGLVTVGSSAERASVMVTWNEGGHPDTSGVVWTANGHIQNEYYAGATKIGNPTADFYEQANRVFKSIRFYSLDPRRIGTPVALTPNMELDQDGSNLAGALTVLRDQDEDAYLSLRNEFRKWLHEFDQIILDTPTQGQRSLALRQVSTRKPVRAADLSQGTLIALCLLAVAYDRRSFSIICLEEPDRGLHPRLLRDVRDALHRLSFPSEFNIQRPAIQVIVTTHSPYFLDLFKDHPNEVIVAEKHEDGTASFKCLADDPGLQEIIGDAPLGEVWFSGTLGGTPVGK